MPGSGADLGIGARHMRNIPSELVTRYESEGWWTKDTIGDLLTRGLDAAPDTEFRVHSAVRPYTGTFRDVELVARRLAAGLRERGVGPGDVVAFQLPNWMEAAAVFWASAFLGAAVVPIVHFYGRKELEFIVRVVKPRVFVTARRFGRMEFQPDLVADVPIVGGVDHDGAGAGGGPEDPVAGSAAGAVAGPAAGAVAGSAARAVVDFSELLDDEPMAGVCRTDPAGRALVAFTSG